MIIDQFINAQSYKIIPSEIVDFDFDLKEFKKGKFEIKGDELFGIGLEYQTDVAEKGLWEAHRKYIDLHYIIEGEELIHVSNIDKMEATNGYQDDYQLFKGTPEQEILLKAGDFILLYPHEVHQTSILNKNKSTVKKIVFKLKLQ